MRHWSRFEHFRKVKGELKRPGLTMREESGMNGGQEKGFCFMRWKERFLVPDHKVRDISGASFAGRLRITGYRLDVDVPSGFYYLQLDLDPPPPAGRRIALPYLISLTPCSSANSSSLS